MTHPLQTIIVIAVVAAAAICAAIMAWRAIRRRNDPCAGCSGCVVSKSKCKEK